MVMTSSTGPSLFLRYNREGLGSKVTIGDQKNSYKFIRYIHELIITVIVITGFNSS